MSKRLKPLTKAVLIIAVILALAGCAQPDTPAENRPSVQFDTELFLYPEAQVRNVMETTDTAGNKVVVFLSTQSTPAAVLSFYRIRAVQAGLRVSEERETARGFLLTLLNRDRRAATIAIYMKENGSDVVIEYYPEAIPESGR